MIRKPSEEDFREGTAVKALRESRNIAVEGSKGVGAGLNRLILLWFGGIMAFAFTISLIPLLGPWGFLLLLGGGIYYWRERKQAADARIEAIRQEPVRLWQQATAPAARLPDEQTCSDASPAVADDVAFPDEIRREGSFKADVSAVTQQMFTLFGIGLLIMILFGSSLGSGIGIVFGIMLVMLAVLVGSRIFGHRKIIEWDTRKVKVWHLLSEGEMQWSDVSDVTVEKRSRFNLGVYFQSGSRRNIVLTAPLNRLGGPNTLRVPIRYLNLPPEALEMLLRDLFCWQAAGNSIAPQAALQQQRPVQTPAPSPSSDPRESFDADAIMAQYLQQRRETICAAGREDDDAIGQSAIPSQSNQRPVFGRKRA